MTAEEKLLLGLLHLSINHNSQVMELATHFVGNMNSKANIRKAHKAFKQVHKSYNDSYGELIASLEKEIIDEVSNNSPLPEPNCTISKHSHRLKDCPDRR